MELEEKKRDLIKVTSDNFERLNDLTVLKKPSYFCIRILVQNRSGDFIFK